MNIKKLLMATAAIGLGTIAVAPVAQAVGSAHPGVALAVELAHPPSGAQPGPLRGMMGHGHRGQAGGGKLQAAMDKLNLTDDQKAKVKPIVDDTKQQIMALRSDSSLSMDEKKARGRQIMMAAFMQIKPILTPAQQEQLKQMIQQASAKQGAK